MVKGDKIHPIYNWLTSSKLNGVLDLVLNGTSKNIL